MINCVAIDDEPLALLVVSEFCGTHPDLSLCRTFTGTREAEVYLKKYPVDLLFLDIQMPESGIDFYRRCGGDRMVIFTTAFSEYAVEGFHLDAIDYLLKPFEKARFDLAIQRAREYHQFIHRSHTRPSLLFVRSEYRLVRIETPEIEYIETMDDYLKIHLKDRKTVITKMNMKNVMEKLDPQEFVRIHRSYIVPIKKVTAVRNRHAEVSGRKIPIGDSYEQHFRERFSGGH